MLPASSPGPVRDGDTRANADQPSPDRRSAEHRAQGLADEQAAQRRHRVPDPARVAHIQQQRQPERKRRAAHQHQRGQWIPVDTDENADPEAGRDGEREDACRDGDRPSIVGPAGEADESGPAVERHDAQRDQDEHPGHREQHAVGATNDVGGVRIPARSAQLRAGAQHRRTDAEVSEGKKQRDRRDQGHQPEYGLAGFAHDDRGVREAQSSDNGRAEDAVDGTVEQRSTLLGCKSTLIHCHRRTADPAERTTILAALRTAYARAKGPGRPYRNADRIERRTPPNDRANTAALTGLVHR